MVRLPPLPQARALGAARAGGGRVTASSGKECAQPKRVPQGPELGSEREACPPVEKLAGMQGSQTRRDAAARPFQCPDCDPEAVPVGPCVLELCAACLAATFWRALFGYPESAEGA